jgi:proteic killer suppression protein
MIRSFRDKAAESVFGGVRPKGFPAPFEVSRRKLRMLHAAREIRDLYSPPGNRPKKLETDRAGQWSIRINDQYRICFEWREGDAYEVEITDYH